jgi:hypothetical protein
MAARVSVVRHLCWAKRKQPRVSQAALNRAVWQPACAQVR